MLPIWSTCVWWVAEVCVCATYVPYMGYVCKVKYIAYQNASTSSKDKNKRTTSTITDDRFLYCSSTLIFMLYYCVYILLCLQSTRFHCVSPYPHSTMSLYVYPQVSKVCLHLYPQVSNAFQMCVSI